MPRSKVELFAAIRRDSGVEGLSVRGLARKYGVHRRPVREALSSAWPRPRKKLPPRRSRLDPFKPAIDAMLRADLDAPRKQHHTADSIARSTRPGGTTGGTHKDLRVTLSDDSVQSVTRSDVVLSGKSQRNPRTNRAPSHQRECAHVLRAPGRAPTRRERGRPALLRRELVINGTFSVPTTPWTRQTRSAVPS
jgi:hypothetical protein